MNREQIERALNDLVECLAEKEHERWSHWQRYMHERGIKQSDGSLLIPPKFVMRWEKQIETGYDQLSEREKDSDREQVRKYLPLIQDALSKLSD
jgi:hypothetical protein